MLSTSIGKWIIFVGIGLVMVWLIVFIAAKLGLPIGRLPGDIYIKKEKTSFYFPIVTMIVLSILLTLNVVLRLFRK